MKKKTIALLLVLMLVFGVSVGGTMAYLMDTKSVTNTFTVGKVQITLDEALVDEYGASITGKETVRIPNNDDEYKDIKGNEYKLIPGHTYIKDPTVHVQPGSEKCYVFVKVENGISRVETATEANTIAGQIKAKGWTALDKDTYPGVYYKEQNAVAENATAVDLVVFDQFVLADDANLAQYTTTMPEIKITAYAIQFDGMTGVVDAWTKVYGAQ